MLKLDFGNSTTALAMLAFTLLFTSVAEGGGVCCVGCGGITVCGSEVSGECGSCGGSVHAKNLFDLTLSVGNDKPQPYRINESEGVTIKDEESGDSYFLQPKLVKGNQDMVELDVRRIYSVFGWQFSVNYATVQLKRQATGEVPLRIGPFSIWSAEFHYQRAERMI